MVCCCVSRRKSLKPESALTQKDTQVTAYPLSLLEQQTLFAERLGIMWKCPSRCLTSSSSLTSHKTVLRYWAVLLQGLLEGDLNQLAETYHLALVGHKQGTGDGRQSLGAFLYTFWAVWVPAVGPLWPWEGEVLRGNQQQKMRLSHLLGCPWVSLSWEVAVGNIEEPDSQVQ